MNFDILKYLKLSLKVTVMSYFQKITEHFHPKLVCGVWLKDNSSNIVSQGIDNADEMSGCWSFLHNREVECPNHTIRMSAVALNVNILSIQTWSLKVCLINSLSPSYITHRNLIVFIQWHILGKGMAADDELLSICDMLILFKNVSYWSASVNRLFKLRVTSFHRPWLHHDFKDLAIFDYDALS